MSKAITHIGRVLAQYKYNTSQVLWLTGMSDKELSQLMYDTGVAWLQYYTKENTELLRALLQDETIWGWWKSEWYLRDDRQYLDALFGMPKQKRIARYRALHQQIFEEHSDQHVQLSNSYMLAVGIYFKKMSQKLTT